MASLSAGDIGLEDQIRDVLDRLGPIADQLGSRAPVAQYEADIDDPGATRRGTSIESSTGPLPRFLAVRDILRIAFNIESLVPHGTVPRRQERSARSPTDDNLATTIPYAPSLLAALELVARYGDAAVPWYERSVTEIDGMLQVAYWPRVPLGRIEPLATEVAMSTIHRIVETFVGNRVETAKVRFPIVPVSGVAAVQARFACDVQLGGSRACMTFPASWGALPSPYHDPQQWLEGLARCEQDIQQLTDRSLVARVRAHIRDQLDKGRAATLAETAAALHMSERTLVRTLASEGQTHHAIADAERLSRARLLLARRAVPIVEIAERLGFADQSSFGRKCRVWFGESPSAVRRRLQGAAAT